MYWILKDSSNAPLRKYNLSRVFPCQKPGGNYNQIVKAINAHFSNVTIT